jgi:transposase
MKDAKYIGLDVHQATISVAILDSAGKLVMEAILETKAETILQFICGLRGSLHVTFEEGTCAAWLYELLQRRVTQVVVCDPRKNALLKSGNKNDRIDARKLADPRGLVESLEPSFMFAKVGPLPLQNTVQNQIGREQRDAGDRALLDDDFVELRVQFRRHVAQNPALRFVVEHRNDSAGHCRSHHSPVSAESLRQIMRQDTTPTHASTRMRMEDGLKVREGPRIHCVRCWRLSQCDGQRIVHAPIINEYLTRSQVK